MTVNYTTNLSLGQPVTGTESGTWGDDVNNAVTSYLDIAISGSLALTSASFTANALTLTNTLGDSSATNIGAPNASTQWTAQYYVLRLSSLAANVTITAPSVSKTYLVVNADATYSVTVKALGQTGISVAAGERATAYYNGTDYIKVTSSVVSNLTGTLPVASGGTGVITSTGTDSTVLSASPTLTGTPLAPTAATSTNTTQLATTAFVQAVMQTLHPVGSIYINATNSTNPGTLLGFGTWTAFGAGRVPVGFDSTNALFDTAEETGGSADAITVSHTHTATSTDAGHTHPFTQTQSTKAGGGPTNVASSSENTGGTWSQTTSSGTASITTTIASAGSSATNANYQPYITVYMWKRTA